MLHVGLTARVDTRSIDATAAKPVPLGLAGNPGTELLRHSAAARSESGDATAVKSWACV